MKVDIKKIGVPNVCFSLDEREGFVEQRMDRGFDDSETWSLRDTIGNFIIPRLKRFKELRQEHVMDKNDMLNKIDLSIRAFELLVRDKGAFLLSFEEELAYEKGMRAYNEIFLDLCW